MLIDIDNKDLAIIYVSYHNRVMDKSVSKGNQPKWYVDNTWIKLDKREHLIQY